MPTTTLRRVTLALAGACLVACSQTPQLFDDPILELVATSDRQWTGLAVSQEAEPRVFVNYPLWSAEQPFAVGELGSDGQVTPWPDKRWNSWTEGVDPSTHFVCVQAMWADPIGRLWILDPANPRFEGVVAGGAKLLVFDLEDGSLEQRFDFVAPVIKPNSYLNDLRVDLEENVGYLTDSGDGALIVLDLATRVARRCLDDHPSTSPEDTQVVVGGRPWLQNGATPQVHSDGIALSPGRDQLYWQALTGRTLHAIPTEILRDANATEADRVAAIVTVAEVGPSDGLLCPLDGSVLLTSLEEDAIRRVDPKTGEITIVVADPQISWPDSMALGADGSVWFTTARIHEGASPTGPYGIWRIR